MRHKPDRTRRPPTVGPSSRKPSRVVRGPDRTEDPVCPSPTGSVGDGSEPLRRSRSFPGRGPLPSVDLGGQTLVQGRRTTSPARPPPFRRPGVYPPLHKGGPAEGQDIGLVCLRRGYGSESFHPLGRRGEGKTFGLGSTSVSTYDAPGAGRPRPQPGRLPAHRT